jgi:hypothetical protein
MRQLRVQEPNFVVIDFLMSHLGAKIVVKCQS